METYKNEQLLIATRNKGKFEEFKRIFEKTSIVLVNLDETGVEMDVDECGETFVENALLKADGYMVATGYLTLADDSGLEVDILDGAPGVRSARYAGIDASDEDRVNKLLFELKDVPEELRRARYRAVLALASPASPNEKPVTAEGIVEGRIALTPDGEGGFGYDSIFYVNEYECTMARLSPHQKDLISHRGIAARKITQILAKACRNLRC